MNKDTHRTLELQDPREHFPQPPQPEYSIFGCREATLRYPRPGVEPKTAFIPRTRGYENGIQL